MTKKQNDVELILVKLGSMTDEGFYKMYIECLKGSGVPKEDFDKTIFQIGLMEMYKIVNQALEVTKKSNSNAYKIGLN